MDNTNITEHSNSELTELTNGILTETRSYLPEKSKTISMPISALATLGAGVSSLNIPFRTITQNLSFQDNELYRFVNKGIGDQLKISKKDGTFWGAIKSGDGTSKMGKLVAADNISITNTTKMPIDPTTAMMAVALYSIEKQLDDIAETSKKILNFLENEKESEIEADVETLSSLIAKYKYNWDNEHFVNSNHKLVLDIQRTAKKNMISYRKSIKDILNENHFFLSQSQVCNVLNDLLKKFRYYRLSLYSYSLSSLIEILLSGNFKEENIAESKSEIDKMAFSYREIYSECSSFLEKSSNSSIEKNLVSGLGNASKTFGGFIGNIPFIKESQVDGFLEKQGANLKNGAEKMPLEIVKSFNSISNPKISVFIDKMNDIIRIYNHTNEICFDKENIYLLTD